MKPVPILLLLNLSLACHGQPDYVRFKGTVYGPDSSHIENAYLINYRNLRAFATDDNGNFDLIIESGDSIKVHHVSFSSIVVKPMPGIEEHKIYLNYENNPIEAVTVKLNDINGKNLDATMGLMLEELRKEFYYTGPKGELRNPYAPSSQQSQEVGINLFELIKWIKHKKKHQDE